MAGGVDAGVLEEAGLGAGHAVDGAAEHGLDWGVIVCAVIGQSGFDGVDLGDVGFIGGHPAADAGVEFVDVLEDEGAAGVVAIGADAVEGEDEGVAELVDVTAEPEGGGVGEVGAGDEFGRDGVGAVGAERAGDGAVRADQDAGVVETEGAQDAHGEGVASASGDNDLYAGGFGDEQGGEVARADASVVTEEGAVHVDGDHADSAGFGCGLQDSLFGCWLLVAGCWLLVAGC